MRSRRTARKSIILLVLLAGCTSGPPEKLSESSTAGPTASPSSSSEPAPSSPTSEPQQNGSKDDQSDGPSAGAATDWNTVRIGVVGGTAEHEYFLNAPDGGYLLLGNIRDPEDDDGDFLELGIRHVTADGKVGKRYGVAGYAEIYDHYWVESFDLYDVGKQPDGSLVLTSFAIADTHGYLKILKVRSNGTVDKGYGGKHGTRTNKLIANYFATDYLDYRRTAAATVLSDGSARLCYRDTDKRTVFAGFDPDGRNAQEVGPDGIRDFPDPDADGCAQAVTTSGDKSVFVLESEPVSGSNQIRLVRLDRKGLIDPSFKQRSLTYDQRILRVTQMQSSQDGSLFVAGRVLNQETPRSVGFVARANSYGSWDRSFGDGGVVTFDMFSEVSSIDPAGPRLLVSGSNNGKKNSGRVVALDAKTGDLDKEVFDGGIFELPQPTSRVLIDSTRRLITDGSVSSTGNKNGYFLLHRHTLALPRAQS